MKLNEEEMYNAYPWLLTVPRVGISFIFLKLVYKSSPSLGHCLPKPWASCAQYCCSANHRMMTLRTSPLA